MDTKTDDTPTVEGMAIRSARLAHTLLNWKDARAALRRGTKLLTEWEKAQAKLPNQHATE